MNGNSLSKLPLSVDQFAMLSTIVKRLSEVTGVCAIVLGGSFASGRQRADSDMDVAIYYSDRKPLDIEGIRGVAVALSIAGAPIVTQPYEWGPWVNGGSWLATTAGRVDFLYRNLEQVQRTIAEAKVGIIHHDYAQQPPTGFFSVTYLAESNICVPLHDPDGVIADLKHSVAIYPPALQYAIVNNALWSAEFTLLVLPKFVSAGDVANTTACAVRVFTELKQALYAINEQYFLSDKSAAADLVGFKKCPEHFVERVADILSDPGSTAAQLAETFVRVQMLWKEVVALAPSYRPKFQIA